MLKPKAGPTQKHWANVSDEQLAGLDLEIEGPDKLPGIVTEIPPGNVETYMSLPTILGEWVARKNLFASTVTTGICMVR